MKLEVGEIITLENGKEYICIKNGNLNGKEYVFLIRNFKPVEIKFGEVLHINDEISIRIVNNIEEKQELINLFITNE